MTQLCISMPALAAPEGARLLSEAVSVGKIAAVVITPATAGGAVAPADALPLIAAAQAAGAAVLISDDAQLARTLKADGVHLSSRPEIVAAAEEAREIVGQGGIVGIDAGSSRHDAMEAGELGVDYVAFGLPNGADAGDRDARFELVAWWAEIFEIPVLATGVEDAQDASALAGTNCDFVSIDLSIPGDAAERVRAIASAIAAATPVAVA